MYAIYLTPDEYEIYCQGAEVTEFNILFASKSIDAYIGKTIGVEDKTEMVTLNKKKQGRLSKHPILDIYDIEAIYHNPFGISAEPVNLKSIMLEDYGFFTYFPIGSSYNYLVFGCTPTKLRVSYKHGYKEIPEDIKVACGIIAANHARNQSMGGFSNAKQVSSLDYNVVLFDDKIMSSNERLILNKYRDV